MPRIARGLADGCIYHVLNRGNGRQEVFHSHLDYEEFIGLLCEGRERFAVRLLAYCLMPNHFHLLLQAEEGEALSRCMQWVMTSHVRRYRKKHGGSGHIWQGRYKSFIVQEDTHLLTVARYIEANPRQAGLVASALEWPWSSHGEHAGSSGRSSTDRLPIDLPAEWTRFVDMALTGYERETLQKSLRRQTPFGSIDWQARVGLELGLGSTLRTQGRPRRGKN